VAGEAITDDRVEKVIGAPLKKLEGRTYTLKRRRLEALMTERLLAREAAKQGVSVEALLDAEVALGRPAARTYAPDRGGAGADVLTSRDAVRRPRVIESSARGLRTAG